jgi:isopentenyldiphosphate isomerase
MMDRVIVVNERDEEIGTMLRSDAHRDGTPHRIAVTYVENAVGHIVVQVRKSGELDHSSAGHVDPGESYADAAKRELAEELGIADVDLKRIGHGVSLNQRKADGTLTTHVFDVFTCTAFYKQLQKAEVEDAYWDDPNDILEDMMSDTSSAKYAGGFRASLPIYLASRRPK